MKKNNLIDILPRNKKDQFEYFIKNYAKNIPRECMINFEYDLLFISNYKSGSRTLLDLCEHMYTKDEPNTAVLALQNTAPIQSGILDKFTKITTCRDPYSRLISSFSEVALKNGRHKRINVFNDMYGTHLFDKDLISIDYLKDQVYSFLVYIEFTLKCKRTDVVSVDHHVYPQYMFLKDWDLDYIIPIENFQKEIKAMCDKLNIKLNKYDKNHKMNKTEIKGYAELNMSDWLSNESVELINDIYAIDFETLDYEMKTYDEIVEKDRIEKNEKIINNDRD